MTTLAEKFRPKTLSDVAGQEHIAGKNGFLTQLILEKKLLSLLLYGPPGTGKTTLALIYAKAFSLDFFYCSAVATPISELRKMLALEDTPTLFPKILFLDEIHRYNKAQQDFFLPFVEKGSLVLIAATTENPSFNLNSALLSRLRVLQLNPLQKEDLQKILKNFSAKEQKEIPENIQNMLMDLAQGDARHLFNLLENLSGKDFATLTPQELSLYLQRRAAHYDARDDQHYFLISALHKSVRGSDPDAALFWLARMLNGGEDPLYIARRLIRMAVEDVGLADPQALLIAKAAYETFDILGSPEGELALAEATIYLALAPKSNALYVGFDMAKEYAKKNSHLPPPEHIINAPTKLMEELGYGEGYEYDHDTKEGFSGQNYFPKNCERQAFYNPQDRGFEREMKKRVEYFQKLRARKNS